MRVNLKNNRLKLNNNRLLINSWMPDGNCFVWYDPPDESVIRLQTGVSEMLDKGSLGISMVQTVASDQPDYGAVIYRDKKVISFNVGGGNEYLEADVSSFTLPDFVLAIAFKPNVAGSKYNSIFSYSGDSDDFQIDSGDGTYWYGELRTAGYGNNFYDNVDSVNTPQILGFTGDKTSEILTAYKNGEEKFQITNFTGFDTTNDLFRIGANRNASRFLKCDFYEMIIAPIAYTTEVHDYLKHRWGIE